MTPIVRRVVYRHTAGPYPGLRQIIALAVTGADQPPVLAYLHTGEVRALDPGPLPDKLAPVRLQPDGRPSKALRLVSKPGYVVYQEQAIDAVGDRREPAAADLEPYL